MNDFETFLQQATFELGIGPTQAETATGGLLRFVTEQLDRMDAVALMDALPGSYRLLTDQIKRSGQVSLPGAPEFDAPASAHPAIAGRLGLLEVIKSADLDTSTALALMEMFLVLVRTHTTAEFVDRLVARVAELRLPRAREARAT